MPALCRFGVSIEGPLLKEFDRLIGSTGYVNRSEALRDLIRARLVEERVAAGGETMFGVLTLVYDHHQRELESRMTDLQHQHHERIVSTTHIHIDHHNCLEVVMLRGTPLELRSIADTLGALKGVEHHKLVLTAGPRNHKHHKGHRR
jgi:CopG family nickel-responsive transcriptional regulator